MNNHHCSTRSRVPRRRTKPRPASHRAVQRAARRVSRGLSRSRCSAATRQRRWPSWWLSAGSREAAAVRELRAVTHWADLHRVGHVGAVDPEVRGGTTADPQRSRAAGSSSLGWRGSCGWLGQGAFRVVEFAVAELATALGIDRARRTGLRRASHRAAGPVAAVLGPGDGRQVAGVEGPPGRRADHPAPGEVAEAVDAQPGAVRRQDDASGASCVPSTPRCCATTPTSPLTREARPLRDAARGSRTASTAPPTSPRCSTPLTPTRSTTPSTPSRPPWAASGTATPATSAVPAPSASWPTPSTPSTSRDRRLHRHRRPTASTAADGATPTTKTGPSAGKQRAKRRIPDPARSTSTSMLARPFGPARQVAAKPANRPRTWGASTRPAGSSEPARWP